MDLVASVQRDRELMLKAVDIAKERGLDLAHESANYYTIKNMRVLELRGEGKSSTEINLIIKGDKAVSDALFKRDCAQVLYDSAKEAIQAYKLSARLIESQIQREWNLTGGQL